ncbi:MAG: N-acetylmuramoyl-L-alanine amidase, partial [Pygmaiobacter sp.]
MYSLRALRCGLLKKRGAAVLLLLCAGLVFTAWQGRFSLPWTVQGGLRAAGAKTQQMQPPYALQTAPPYTVAVDAGHGGMDTGAQALLDELEVCNGTAEELCAWLIADPNYCPVRTRPADADRTSEERAETATECRASLLISIHANCDHSTGQSHGFECFPTPPGRLYSAQSLQFAQCIAQEMEKAGHHLRGENGIRFAYYSGHSKKIVDSTDTAVRTQRSFGIVEKIGCPAVLAEQGFLTNAQDVK